MHSQGGLLWYLGRISEWLSHHHYVQRMLRDMTAETRLGQFLLSLASRFSSHGDSIHEFSLSMTRQDIANHFNIALETVSRLVTSFQQSGLLKVNRRRITIRDAEGLAAR